MNVDHEDELRIQAPPGAASASESRLQLDGTGLMPEAQERKQKFNRARTLLQKKAKEKILRRESAGDVLGEVREGVLIRVRTRADLR